MADKPVKIVSDLLTRKQILKQDISGNVLFKVSGTLEEGSVSSSFPITASYFVGSGLYLTDISASTVATSSYALTAGYAENANGALTSVYTSGSITGSGLLANPITLTDPLLIGQITASQGFSGYLYGTASQAVSSSYATYAENAVGAGVIGEAEDGNYADGLFTDFTSTTLIGVPIDRFNEILKILVPSPAPDASRISSSNAGSELLLSFGSSGSVAGYTNVGTTAGFSAVNVNGQYSRGTNSNNFRLGIFTGTTIDGNINFHVPATYNDAYLNYSARAFSEGGAGNLQLFVNGILEHQVDLSSFAGSGNPGSGTATSLNASGSGFINVSVSASATDAQNRKFPVFQHRTADFRIANNSQRNGWNYARVIHSGSFGSRTTNYVEWVRDNNGENITATNASLNSYSISGSKYLSGVQYFRSGSATYTANVNNFYKNTFSQNTITFNSTNASLSSQTVPLILTGSGETNEKVIAITASATITATSLYSGSLAASLNLSHPLKNTLAGAGAAYLNGILLDNLSSTSTALSETFKGEEYRITSGSYNTQASATSSVWNSQVQMTGSQSDGLLFYNSKLVAPRNSLNNGDFRNTTDGGVLGIAPSGNPNYSGITTGIRTLYRYFKNTTGSTKRDIVLTINGTNTTIVTAETSIVGQASKIKVFVKVPEQTGWLDVAKAFTYNTVSDNSGCYVLSLASVLNATNYLSFGTYGVANNDNIVVKIEADASWSGDINQIVVTFGAGTGTTTIAPILSAINGEQSGVTAKLSFGSSKAISGYTSVGSGAGIGSAVDVNGLYTPTGNRLGIFASTQAMTGYLNSNVGSNMPSYPAYAFADGNLGYLKLEVNGTVVQQVEITGSIGASSLNGNGSGFTNISAATTALYSNSIPDWTKFYRTAKYNVAVGDQRNGWNYVRAIHSGSGFERTTTYAEWVNDNNANALGSGSITLNNFYGTSVYYLSGIKYFTQVSSSFAYSASNVYKNIFSNSSTAITFPVTTNLSLQTITVSGSGIGYNGVTASYSALPNLLTSVVDSQNYDIVVTGNVLFTQSKSLVGSYGSGYIHTASVNSSIIHPLKSTLTTSTLSKAGFLVFSGSETSNLNTNETITGETYRLQSGSYTSQASVTSSGNSWNSQISVNDNSTYPTYANGLVIYNGYLLSPKKAGVSGDFRNVADGGIVQGPNANVNYSSLTNATRQYYRYFRSNISSDVALMTVTLYGDANLISKSGAFNTGSLGANKNIHLEVKIPGDSGWLDVAKPADVSEDITLDGAGGFNGGGNDVNQTVVVGGTSYGINTRTATINGTASPGGADYIVVRITANENWTGYLTRIAVSYG